MAESTLSVEYTSLRRQIGHLLGLKPDPANWLARQTTLVDDLIDRGYRMFLYPSPQLTGGKAHTWSFLRPIKPLTTVAPYDTGTVEIVDGVVTLTGGTFPSWGASGELIVGSDLYYVASLDGGLTELTLTDTTVDAEAGTSFKLVRSSYDLPDEFGGIDGPLTFRPGRAELYAPVEIINERQIDIRRQRKSPQTGRPTCAAIRPKVLDQTVGQRYTVTLDPPPDDLYEFRYRMTANPPKLDATSKYPMGGLPHAETILQACLAAAEQHLDGQRGTHYGYFVEALNASITHDKQATTPETLGYNGDPSNRHSLYDTALSEMWPVNLIAQYDGHDLFMG